MPFPVYQAKMLPGPRSLDKPVVRHAVWDRGPVSGIEFPRVGEAKPESKCPSKARTSFGGEGS